MEKSGLGIITRFHVLVNLSSKRSYQIALGSIFPAHQTRLYRVWNVKTSLTAGLGIIDRHQISFDRNIGLLKARSEATGRLEPPPARASANPIQIGKDAPTLSHSGKFGAEVAGRIKTS